MNSLPLIIAICLGFIFSFLKHISFVMYFASGIIFYFYLPVLYSYARVNILNHVKAKEFLHLKYYPLEFLFWLATTCFFSFILAHLLADLFYEINKPIHVIAFPLILACLILICYRELAAKKLHNQDVKINYEKQGRLICFQVLFIFVLLFLLHH
jgi:hypothetical protein